MKKQKKEKEIKYSMNEIAFGMSVEPYVKQMLFDEDIKYVAPYELASVCMGIYEMYKVLLENNTLLDEEEKDVTLFLQNYEQSIRDSLLKIFKQHREIQELEEQNILYN